jgi:anti-anti-sigma regulatory factor
LSKIQTCQCRFFRQLQAHVKHRDVFIDLSGVTRITPDAIALLLAIVRQLEKRRLHVSGNYPDEPSATETIRESGFNDYLKTSMRPSGSKKGAIVRQDLSQHSKDADGQYARKLIDFAEADGQNRLRLKVAYAHLVECMGNTHQHAGAHPGEQTWWAAVFRDTRRHCDCFTFVDMGIGIFNSAELSIRLKMYKFTGFGRQKILKELLEGKIPSSTGKAYRGRGLPSIYQSCIQQKVRRLVIVTNDVFADAERNDFRPLSHDIKGVVLYWEVPHGS